ncbi:MAG: TRAP transporter substrate-binding protein [Alphaproteobacteria bacterium]|nr:TRAP transporter substrate-binding protein [Alphaproteobacteria bacterium]
MKKLILAAAGLLLTTTAAAAQEVTLRLHHFMGEKAPLHGKMMVPLAAAIEEASEGRMKVEVFSGMSLGGRPGDLYDQAADGAVDIVVTLPGYTAGRFNHSEVFELPFMMKDPVATAEAYYDLIAQELQDGEFEETKILTSWVHGPGVLHSKEPISSLEDMVGQEMRGPTRVVTDLLGELGATPVGMPLPLIPENLSKGVISGTVLPWEVTPSIRLAELVSNHTELSGDTSLYTAVFIMAMNWNSYEGLPDDLRQILDDHTGKGLAASTAQVMLDADAGGRNVASGNTFITLDGAEIERWKAAAQPVVDRWVTRAGEMGFDGEAAIAQARALIDANL